MQRERERESESSPPPLPFQIAAATSLCEARRRPWPPPRARPTHLSEEKKRMKKNRQRNPPTTLPPLSLSTRDSSSWPRPIPVSSGGAQHTPVILSLRSFISSGQIRPSRSPRTPMARVSGWSLPYCSPGTSPSPPIVLLQVSMERTGRRRGHWIRDSSRGIPSPARGRTHPDAAAAPRLAHQLDGGPWRWLLLIFQWRPPVPRTASTRRMTTNGNPHPMTSALTATATPSSPAQGTKHTNRATEKPADIKFESC